MKTRKILSILLCAIMVMAVIPVSVLMASAEDANITIRGYQQTKVESGVWSVRFVATGKQVEGIERVGFEVTLTDGQTVDKSTTIVYESLNANYGAETVTASSYSDEWITAIAVNEIPYTSGELEFTVKPYIQVSGEKQYGDAQTAKIYPNYDESYLTKKDDRSYYISNFNNSEVMNGVIPYGINPWAGWTSNDNATVTHGSLTNGHGTVTGVNVAVQNYYAGFRYWLPKAFDLSQAKYMVFKIAASNWHNGYAGAFILLESGDKFINIDDYSTFYSGTTLTGEALNYGDAVITVNYLSGFAVLDVEALMKAESITSIDSIIFGQNSSTTTHTLDEVYYITNYDPSYMTKKDDMSYYISNFDNESILKGTTAVGKNPWLGNTTTSNLTISQGTTTNGHGSFTGLQITQNANGYSGAEYTLPLPFELSKAETLVFKFSASAWGNNYANLTFLLRSGSTYYAVYDYWTFYNGNTMSGTKVDGYSGSVISANFLSGYVEIDVAAFMAANPSVKTIDAIYFGRNQSSATVHVLDEVYYTVAVGDDGVKLDPSTSNTSKGSYTTTDTEDDMLQISGASWGTGVTYTMSRSLDVADISTITVRYKSTGSGTPFMYLNADSGDTALYMQMGSTTYGTVTTDEEGFTLYEIDLSKVTAENEKITSVGAFVFKNNNAACVTLIDYILIK